MLSHTPTRLHRAIIAAVIAAGAAAALAPTAGAAVHQPPKWLRKVEAATSTAPVLASRAVPQVKGGAPAISVTSLKQRIAASWLGNQLVQGRVGSQWYITVGNNCFTVQKTTFPTAQPDAYALIPTEATASTTSGGVTYNRTSRNSASWIVAKTGQHSTEHGTFTWNSHNRLVSIHTTPYTTGTGKSRGHVDAEVTTITYPASAPKTTPRNLPKCVKKAS